MVRALMLAMIFLWVEGPTPALAQTTKKCVGIKQYYAGKCRYPNEIKKLKAKKRKKRGSLGGRCYQNKTCNQALVCNDKLRCIEPPVGTLGGACYGNKTCNLGLHCNDEALCEKVALGSLSGPCYGNGTCDKELMCSNKVCIKRPSTVKNTRSPKSRTDIRIIRATDGKKLNAQKAKELPSLRRLGLVMFDVDPRWKVTMERDNGVELTNKAMGVVFTVTTEVRSGTFSLWKGKIQGQLRRSGTDIRRSRLLRLDGAQGVLITGSSPDRRGKLSLGYNEYLMKTGDILVRLQWVSSKNKEKAIASFVAALKTARLLAPLRTRRTRN